MSTRPRPEPQTLEALLRPLAADQPLTASALLSRVLVHEVGNGLNPMGLQIELLRRRCAEDARAMEVLDALHGAVHDLGRMLERVRDFAYDVAPPSSDGEDRKALIEAATTIVRGR